MTGIDPSWLLVSPLLSLSKYFPETFTFICFFLCLGILILPTEYLSGFPKTITVMAKNAKKVSVCSKWFKERISRGTGVNGFGGEKGPPMSGLSEASIFFLRASLRAGEDSKS